MRKGEEGRREDEENDSRPKENRGEEKTGEWNGE